MRYATLKAVDARVFLKQCLGYFFLFLLSAGIATAQSASPTAPDKISTSATEAEVSLFALDHAGHPVPEISPDSLRVFLDGKPTRIQNLRPLKDVPLIFSLVVDVSGSSGVTAEKQSATATLVFKTLSTGPNHGYLVLFNDTVRESFNYVDAQTAEEVLKKSPRKGPTALYDAIMFACTRQLHWDSSPAPRRRAIFVVSDGEDNTSRYTLVKTIEAVQREGIPVFTIMTSFDSGSKRARREGYEALRALSVQTGGLLLLPDEHQEELIQGLPSVLQAHYLLTLHKPEFKANKAHSLRIETNDLQILAQNQYMEP